MPRRSLLGQLDGGVRTTVDAAFNASLNTAVGAAFDAPLSSAVDAAFNTPLNTAVDAAFNAFFSRPGGGSCGRYGILCDQLGREWPGQHGRRRSRHFFHPYTHLQQWHRPTYEEYYLLSAVNQHRQHTVISSWILECQHRQQCHPQCPSDKRGLRRHDHKTIPHKQSAVSIHHCSSICKELRCSCQKHCELLTTNH